MKVGILASILLTIFGVSVAQGQSGDWNSNWALAPGYFLEVDTSGYTLPVSIAFVPNPGVEPDAPLYYVAELGGKILVVRNDRQVETFAENFFELRMVAEMPELAGVLGLTGLCLDSGTGFLFATYVYDAEDGRYNGITRFSTKRGEFSLRPKGVHHIREPLKLGDSNFTRFPFGHQIGACQIVDDQLYVGIGDGEITYRARSLHSSFGKIIRMNLDGQPVTDSANHSGKSGASSLQDYIFASGLRNPFGQTLLGDKIVVADNGPGVDRVLMVREGEDYLYDGSDDSIATNSMVLISPAKGTANIVFYPDDSPSQIEELKDNIVVVLSGIPETYVEDEPSELSAFGVDENSGLVTTRPRSIVKYVGKQLQVLSSLAISKDGLYFAPVYGENGSPGGSNVYRLSWAPEKKYPNMLAQHVNARTLIKKYGCQGCHVIYGEGGNIGPKLNSAAIRERNLLRLGSAELEEKFAAMNLQSSDAGSNAGRNRVLSLRGEAKLAAWVEEKIKDPTFDNSYSIMPFASIPQNEAKIIATFLTRKKAANRKKPSSKPR